jgi:NitT/TauT family transport system substrate-binding protein
MGNLPVIHALPIYLAIEKGYFKEAGINVQLVPLEAPNQIIDGLMQDKLDFTSTSGAAGISAVANYKNPGKIKIYALSGGTSTNPGEAIVIPIDSNITSISELKGKKLGIIGGSLQWKLLAKYVLKENGLEMDKDVSVVELALGTHVSAIASKQVDALMTIEPAVTTILNKKAGKILESGVLESTLSDPFYPGAGIVSTKFAEANPKTTAKVIEIIKKATKEVDANQTAARQYLKGYTPLTDEIAAIVPIPLIKTCDELDAKDISGLQKFYDIFTTFGAVDGKISAEDILYCKK